MSKELDIKVARILGWTEIEDQENGLVGFAPWKTTPVGIVEEGQVGQIRVSSTYKRG